MTVLDGSWSPRSPSQGEVLVCVGYKNHWEIVNGRTGYSHNLHTVDGNRVHLVAALDLYEDQEIELLLCYNRKQQQTPSSSNYNILAIYFLTDTCHFQKIQEEATTKNSNFDFHWNTVPTNVGK